MSTGFTTLPDGRRQTDKDPSDELRYWADVSGQMATGDTLQRSLYFNIKDL
jgi:hypothetical protein